MLSADNTCSCMSLCMLIMHAVMHVCYACSLCMSLCMLIMHAHYAYIHYTYIIMHVHYACHYARSLCMFSMKLFGNFNNDEMSHNVVHLFSIYDEMTHNVVYLFSTPNLGNNQANMMISPLALNQSKLLKYFQ